MTILNHREATPFTTADGSTICEYLNPRNSPLLNQSLAEATLEPGQSTTEHYHPKAEEIYFILEGQGRMKIQDELHDIEPGDAIAIPNGFPHKIWNTGSITLRFLCCCAPAYSHEDTVLTEVRKKHQT